MKRLLIILILGALLSAPFSYGCFTIVAGKKATVDGSVLFGHNEDDGGRRVVNVWLMPRMTHEKGDFIALTNGGIVPQVEETWSYFWFQMNGLHFSDYYMNEWGVAVASDACGSREDNPELTEGGIGYYLRRIVAERAKTAREGVRIAGDLLDQFGYASSGRTMVICDAEEGWFLSIVAGKHWVAQRVPDNRVAVLPNMYITRKVDFKDTRNFMVSKKDIRSYAIARGWYDEAAGKPFDFSAAYRAQAGSNSKFTKRGYDTRQWQGQRLVTGKTVSVKEAREKGLPFAVIPSKKLTIQDITRVLRDHYEGTPYGPEKSRDMVKALQAQMTGGIPRRITINPNRMSERTICTSTTQHSIVAQLRGHMPSDMGCVLWVSMGRPDCHAYIPWYKGILSIPDGYRNTPGIDNPESALHAHFKPVSGSFDYDEKAVFWRFNDLENLVDLNYSVFRAEADEMWSAFENELHGVHAEFEAATLSIYKKNAVNGRRTLTRYTHSLCDQALRKVNALIQSLKTGFYQ
jgi:dipeptidase